MMEFRHLHWPDFHGVGECEECHQPSGNTHEFTTAESSVLCLECHEEIRDRIQTVEFIHEPVEDGCLDCHNPHGGAVKALLVGIEDQDIRSLCFECHEDEILKQEFPHGPADQGACNTCHDPHGSSISPLLLAAGIDLCGECHEETAERMVTASYVHPPVEDGCTDCHEPHGGPYRKLLTGEKRELCKECHGDMVAMAEGAVVDHAAVLEDGECLNCHAPHAANSAPLLIKPQRELCLGCHNEPVESGDSMLMDMDRLLKDNKEWHKPVIEDGCSGCHLTHGGENFRLLKGPYPARFYAKFSVEKYGLCFSCHEDTVATAQWTRTLTGFRNGDQNLHFLHVNKGKRGRTCRSCHEVHASPFPLHIRERVAYGKWMLPIQYKKTGDGGSCHPGCHNLKAYDREAADYPRKDEE
jgi:predicted CXXCH cytochrome family protein